MVLPADIGLNIHAAILEAPVHSEVNGVESFWAVVLMNQHRVLCDVMAYRALAQDELIWRNFLVQFIHVLSKFHVNNNLIF